MRPATAPADPPGAGAGPRALARVEEARDTPGSALAGCRETGNRRTEGAALNNLGILAFLTGDPAAARRLPAATRSPPPRVPAAGGGGAGGAAAAPLRLLGVIEREREPRRAPGLSREQRRMFRA